MEECCSASVDAVLEDWNVGVLLMVLGLWWSAAVLVLMLCWSAEMLLCYWYSARVVVECCTIGVDVVMECWNVVLLVAPGLLWSAAVIYCLWSTGVEFVVLYLGWLCWSFSSICGLNVGACVVLECWCCYGTLLPSHRHKQGYTHQNDHNIKCSVHDVMCGQLCIVSECDRYSLFFDTYNVIFLQRVWILVEFPHQSNWFNLLTIGLTLMYGMQYYACFIIIACVTIIIDALVEF